jgi:hypothetical protein
VNLVVQSVVAAGTSTLVVKPPWTRQWMCRFRSCPALLFRFFLLSSFYHCLVAWFVIFTTMVDRFRVFSFFALFFFFPGAVQCMCDASRHHQCDSSATSVNLLIADKIIDIEIIEIVTFLELVVTNTSTLP